MAGSLPAPLSSFIGRAREIDEIVDLVRQANVRLVTLVGPGGVGKTRLALQVADRVAPSFADGVTIVSLAPIREPAFVLRAIAQALGLRDASDRPVAQQLAEALCQKDLILVLDNVEQVVEAGPDIATLLSACPRLTVLVTSRAVLHLSGEQVIAVDPLPVPRTDQAVADIRGSPAVQLFVARARSVHARFALTDTNAGSVGQVCRRLDGLPLAIELAAARVAHLPVDAVRAHLDRRLPVLAGGSRDQPARQQTMRDTIAWSYDLLAPDEQWLFQCLGVFTGGFALAAAEAVAADAVPDVLTGIASLIDTSLVRRDTTDGSAPRYAMLETIREFALERLDERGEADAVHARHAAFFTELAEEARASMLMNQTAGLERLRADDGNLLAALGWLERSPDPAPFVSVAAALVDYWFVQSRYGEGRHWLEHALALSEHTPAALRAGAHSAAGLVAIMQGDYTRAEDHYAAAVALWAGVDDPVGMATALGGYGLLAYRQGAYGAARERIEQARSLSQGADPADGVGRTNRIEQVLMLGDIASTVGDLADAAAHYEEAAALARTDAFDWYLSDTLPGLGNVCLLRGDVDQAEALYREGLSVAERFGDTLRLAGALIGLAAVAAARGQAELAARRIGAAEAQYEIAGTTPFRRDARVAEQASTAARHALGEDGFAAARAAGKALTVEGADNGAWTFLATLEPGSSADAPADPRTRHALTHRETEVLALIVEGRTNAVIGDALFISPRTVQNHVTSILGKLGVASRTEAATRAVRDGLI